jgi:hypothetical protein
MKVAWFSFLSLALLTGVVEAQQLTLRSGDHPTFSRITIPVPINQTWEGSRTTKGIELMLPGFSSGFDLEGVFSRMQKIRISSITAKPDSLILNVNCDCGSTIFRNGSLLVIDVADEGAALAGPPLKAQEEIQVALKARPKMQTQNDNATLPWIGSRSPFDETLDLEEISSKTETATVPELSIEKNAALLNKMRKDLAEEFANAASAGLLDANHQPPVPAQAKIHSEPAALAPAELKLPEMLITPSRNLRVTNSMERNLKSSKTRLDATVSGLECPLENFLSIETWGDDTDFSAQIGPARKALMNSRDKLNKSATTDLAKLYLYFGFGAEALNVLRLDQTLLAKHQELVAVATILEHGSLVGHNPFGDYTDCASNVALWASLSFHDIPSDVQLDTKAALRALNKMPKHLRYILAPSLSERLLKYGDGPAAAAALRSIERLAEPLPPEAIMAKADLAAEAGEPTEALLEDVIETNSTQSPAALVKLVEKKMARNEPISHDTVMLIEAYIQELRGTPMGNQLLQTQVIALSQTNNFDETFSALNALGPSIAPKVKIELFQLAFTQLANKADDLTFLENFFAQEPETLATVSTQAKLLLASRLMDLGFAAQVQYIIATIPETLTSTDQKLLSARAALNLRKPFQAQASLIGSDEPEGALLLAKAKEMTGAYREASDIFANNNASKQAAQAALLSDDWRDLKALNTPILESVVALAQVEQLAEDSSLGPLARANRALVESSTARDVLEKLLSDPIVQFAP